MITKDNLKMVIANISIKDIKRLLDSNKEYIVIYLSICNAGYSVSVTLTNDYNRYSSVSNNGDCILLLSEVIEILESLRLEYLNNWLTISRFNEHYGLSDDNNLIEILRDYFDK